MKKPKKLTWLIDLDDTVVNTTAWVVKLMKEQGFKVPEFPPTWRWGVPDIPKYRDGAQYTTIMLEDDKECRIEPCMGAIEFLTFLENEGQDIILLTSRRNILARYTKRWCDHYRVPRKRIVFSAHKWHYDGDIMMDDSPANIYQWITEDRLAFYFRHSLNRGVDFNTSAYPNIQSVDNWLGLTRLKNWEKVVKKWMK